VPFRGYETNAFSSSHIRQIRVIRGQFSPLFLLFFCVLSCLFVAMKFFNNRWFLLVLRLALGGVFLYAGATKVTNPQAFADSIATFKMLPPQLLNIIALGLPPFEILLGLMLISGWKARAASLALAGLSIVFGLALGQALMRGLVVDCGCFGSGEPSPLKTWASFGRAFLLLAGSLWFFRSASNSLKQDTT
jgi:uncharacterized membrane protein YphA (DoxX/SURF4 family)